MATTRSRPRGRETARPNVGGTAAEHKKLIGTCVAAGLVLLIALLTLTTIGHTIDLAVQHFMLFYAGVFALIGLCTSVGAGLAATDRMFLHPGQRVMMQSIHRAASFGAFTFLIIHVVTEILAQRIDVIDAFIPFLQPFKTFYVGLGTIASDIIILLVITGIVRKRFVTNGKGTWRWRAIHYTNYIAFVFGVWHGLLGGRPGKPYVDWSYGFVVAFVALGVAIRVLSNSLRPKEALSAPAIAESAASGTAPLRAAILAQASSVRKPATGPMTALGGSPQMLPAGSDPVSVQVMQALPAGSDYESEYGSEYGSDYESDYVEVLPAGAGYAESGFNETMAAPVYEPGYDGPPRYQGAPRPATGPMRAVPDSTISGPLPQVSGPRGAYDRPRTAPRPPLPPAVQGPPTGGFRRPPTGPIPRVPTGEIPRVPTGEMPRVPSGPGPMPPVTQGPPSGGFQRPMTGPPHRRPPAPPEMPPAGYANAPRGGGYAGVPYAQGGYDGAGYAGTWYYDDSTGYDDGAGYEAAPRWDGVSQDPRRAYRGGDGRR